jgi:DJ-1 family protein
MPRAIVFLAQGFEEMEAVITIDTLRRAGINVTTVATGDMHYVVGAHNITLRADAVMSDLPYYSATQFDLLILPGGQPGTDHLRDDTRVGEWISHQVKEDRWVAAICAAPLALARHAALDGRAFTSHPSVRQALQTVPGEYQEKRVVVDAKIITSRAPGTAFEFALKIVELLVSPEKAAELAETMMLAP